VLLAHAPEELDTVFSGHVVIRDDTVRRAVVDPLEALVGACRCLDGESVVFAFEEGSRHFPKVRLIVDVENAHNSLIHRGYIILDIQDSCDSIGLGGHTRETPKWSDLSVSECAAAILRADE
jgi:hypothetical protein